ncbi:MAG: S41 family peptidase [bacterium]
MKYHQLKIGLILSILFFACNDKDKNASELDGTYEQIGYGRIVAIENTHFILYDKTSSACLPILNGNIDIYGDQLFLQNDTLQLQDGINLYQFKRLDNTPELCNNPLTAEQKTDPLLNFDVLADHFNEQYAYFELRNVNWDSLRAVTRAKISPSTSDPELYRIFEDMLDFFNDGHIGLDAPDEIVEAAELLDTVIEESSNDEGKTYGDLEIAQLIASTYVKNDLQSSRSGLVKWGFMNNRVGYLQVNLMMGHGEIASLEDDLEGMDYLRAYFNALDQFETSLAHTEMEIAGIKATMTEAMNSLESAEVLLLDVRFNGGGKDEVALEIMRHFNSQPKNVFHKKARFGKGFTPNRNVYLDAKRLAYSKPVLLLTSCSSASATEIMVLSSLSLDHVVRVGQTTEGVFSDVLDKTLPNGWEIGLSNEVYQDLKGNNYEHIGIPPNIDLNYPKDRQDLFRYLAKNLEKDKEQVLEQASNYLEVNRLITSF